jgi:hypothetical protein
MKDAGRKIRKGASQSRKESNGRYILKNKKAIPEPDLFKWGRWFESADRKVNKTQVGKYDISTVFLGLDHGFGSTTPLLFETMVFGDDPLNGETMRCSTWKQAEIQHDKMVKYVREYIPSTSVTK